MSYDPLLTVLGLTALASPSTPTTYGATVDRAALRIAPAVLPSTPAAGDLAIDSGAGNRLAWHDGSSWLNVVSLEGAQTITGLKTFSSVVTGPACTAANASFNIPHGTTPTSPVNGDMWTTILGVFIKIDGTNRPFLTLGLTQQIGVVGTTTSALEQSHISSAFTVSPSSVTSQSYHSISGSVYSDSSNVGSALIYGGSFTATYARSVTGGSIADVVGVVGRASANYSLGSGVFSATTVVAVDGVSTISAPSGGSLTVGDMIALRGRLALSDTGSRNITNLVGLHLPTPTIDGTPTITNRYGILQEDASSINSFAGDVVTADAKAFYLGATGVDGSWRIIRDGTGLTMQRRESSVWVTKQTIAA